MKKIRISLLAVFLASLLGGYAVSFLFPEKKVDESLYLKEVAPDIIFSGKTNNYYLSSGGITAFNTHDVTPWIRGYAGPIKLLIALTPDGKIYGIKILQHKETKNYVRGMESPEFLKQFLGKNIADPLEPDKDIDAVSRATVSVDALTKTVRESGRKIASEVMGLEVRGGGGGKPSGFNIKWASYLFLFMLSGSAYFITRRSKKLLRLRDLSLISGIAVLGVWLSTPFSILHVFNILLLRPSSNVLWYMLMGSVIISIIAAGRFYCGWLCPFGAISGFVGRLPFKKWQVPYETDNRWRNLKYLLLGLIVIVVFISRRPEFGNYETYVTLFSLSGNVLTWSLVGMSLFLSLRVERFWCRYLCPVAALTGLFSRRDDRYISSHDCPMGNKPNPLISECIRCNRCYRGK